MSRARAAHTPLIPQDRSQGERTRSPTQRDRTRSDYQSAATARSSLAQAGERVYIDWSGVKRTGTSLPANFARSSALGSPSSSP